MKVQYDYPYRLKLEHADRAEVRLHRSGRCIVFDPTEVKEGDIVVLTGPAPDRIRATAEAVKLGHRPTVLASEEILAWLRGVGAVDEPTGEVDGVTFESLPYTPASTARPMPQRVMAHMGALKPVATFRHLRERATLPTSSPCAWQLTFPDGSRLVHLDLALHRGQEATWKEQAAARFGGADWLVIGSAYGESEGVANSLGAFGARHVLLSDLVNGERRALGLPTELVTPLRDRLVASGVEAHVFATQTSFRFE